MGRAIHPLQAILEDAGLETRSYSGRGMFGDKCLGIVTDDVGDVFEAVINGVDDDNRDEVARAMRGLRTDSMGLSTIVYFRNTAWVDVEELDREAMEDDEDEEIEPCERAHNRETART